MLTFLGCNCLSGNVVNRGISLRVGGLVSGISRRLGCFNCLIFYSGCRASIVVAVPLVVCILVGAILIRIIVLPWRVVASSHACRAWDLKRRASRPSYYRYSLNFCNFHCIIRVPRISKRALSCSWGVKPSSWIIVAIRILVEGRAPWEALFRDLFIFFCGRQIFTNFGNRIIALVVGDSLDWDLINSSGYYCVIVCYLPGSVGCRLHLWLFEVGAFLKWFEIRGKFEKKS